MMPLLAALVFLAFLIATHRTGNLPSEAALLDAEVDRMLEGVVVHDIEADYEDHVEWPLFV